jgi:hypothetical protein
MLWEVAGVLLVPWGFGFHFSHALGGFIPLFLVAVVVLALRVVPVRQVF